MSEQELIYTIAFTKLPRISLQNKHILLQRLGNATQVYNHRNHILDVLSDAHRSLPSALQDFDSYLSPAEQEYEFIKKNSIQCLAFGDEAYPLRLRDCADAPLLLYFLGNANLNNTRIISVVGTRKITEYGKDLCESLIHELSQLSPNTIVVSGLAYGVDIHTHKNALKCGMSTVGVLAHGLDQIYPQLHKSTAISMLEKGGLLTEYPSGTVASKRNFIQRNRIVAGMSDATIVIESASHGGALITADIANSYNRDVFAYPGRIKDEYSAGCNQLIASQKAHLVTSAEDVLNLMGWQTESKSKELLKNGVQQELFLELTDEEQKIVDALKKVDCKQINAIALDTGIPIHKLSGLLFELEMKGVVKLMAGGMYRL